MKIAIAVLSLFCISLQAQVTVFQDVAYDSIEGVEPNLLSLDVYVPEGNEKKPIAIYVHGGGWCIGDKSNVHHKAEMLNDMGYLFVSVNYRLSPFPYELNNPDRIMYPDHPRDVAKAIAFVLDRAENYGGDVDQVFLFGHSTGAHLVATVLADESFLEAYGHSPSAVKCACSMDTGGFELESWITEKANDADLFINAFGSDIETWQQASPELQIGDEDKIPDFLLIYQDNPNRIVANQDFASVIRDKTAANVSELGSAHDHQQINQLLGGTSTVDEAEYTQAFLDWLTPCMARTVDTKTPNISQKTTPIISPNLTNDIARLLTDQEITLFDFQGRVRMTIDGRVEEIISLAHLPAGTYLVVANDGSRQRLVLVR